MSRWALAFCSWKRTFFPCHILTSCLLVLLCLSVCFSFSVFCFSLCYFSFFFRHPVFFLCLLSYSGFCFFVCHFSIFLFLLRFLFLSCCFPAVFFILFLSLSLSVSLSAFLSACLLVLYILDFTSYNLFTIISFGLCICVCFLISWSVLLLYL